MERLSLLQKGGREDNDRKGSLSFRTKEKKKKGGKNNFKGEEGCHL